jgi:microsomal dipeptidase-like Zn-dependent dipeptidase
MANPEALERSGNAIVVAALYANPLFVTSLRNSIRKQIELARRFVKEHPNWIIAESAAQARSALLSGKRVLVLALEGASGIIDNEDDLSEFVDHGGIRIVNLLHLTDDEYGGVAFLPGINVLSSPWAWFKGLFSSHRDEQGVKVNPNGLSDQGRIAARAMIKHGVWLDLAHASDAAQADLLPIASEGGRPLLYTHTALRKYMKAERGITDAQLEKVKASGGIVGAMPAETMLTGTPSDDCDCARSPKACGPFQEFLTQYGELVSKLGPDSVAIGSDWNGGVKHLPPSCGTGTALDHEGLWNIGQTAELWQAMANAGAPVPKPLGRTVARFLDAWERAAKAPSS